MTCTAHLSVSERTYDTPECYDDKHVKERWIRIKCELPDDHNPPHMSFYLGHYDGHIAPTLTGPYEYMLVGPVVAWTDERHTVSPLQFRHYPFKVLEAVCRCGQDPEKLAALLELIDPGLRFVLNGGPFDGIEDHIPANYDSEFGYPPYYDRADGKGAMHRYRLREGCLEQPIQYDYELET